MFKNKLKNKLNLLTLGLLLSCYLNTGFAAGVVIQAGAFSTTQGEAQHININGLVGDDFSVNQSHGQSVLLGLGYYFNGPNFTPINLLYGVDAFYFGPTKVKGDVTQESMFTNLSYQYDLTNYPIYLAGKALIHSNPKYDWTVDLGVGPNMINTGKFSESSLDHGQTEPDTIFSGKTTVALSAMAGVGLRVNQAVGHLPVEISYRFFYLGQGKLDKNTSEVNNNLKTGHNYASALLVSLSF